MNSLSGRYVLLTGGSRGIGPVIADALARRLSFRCLIFYPVARIFEREEFALSRRVDATQTRV